MFIPELIQLALYIIPGYIVLYVVNMITNYLREKDIVERIIHYTFFSIFAYLFALIHLFVSYLLLSWISIIDLSEFFKFDIYDKAYLFIMAIVYALFIGFYLGKNYFSKGYPNNHLNNYTYKKYSQSVFADLEFEYRSKGAYATFHMNDGTVIIGKVVFMDRDEDKRDYSFRLKDVDQIFPDNESIRLQGKDVIINSRDVTIIEFKSTPKYN